MPEPSRAPAASSVITAAICAFATIATQVAGKATRDALFLTNFHISALPIILMASAAISIGVVLVVARWLALAGPSRVIPPMFFASGILLTGEWLLALRDPGLASILIYLHIAVVGAILISGFWSIINEHFDPRSARRNIGRIVGGATVGGLFGGFLADRLGAAAGILWVLPVIAGLQMLCALLLPRLRSSQAAGERVALRALFPGGDRQPRGESGFQVLRRVAYVRNLAFIVLLGNVAATLIDYLFKARAAESFPGSADLVHFFAIFYTAVSLLTLAVQAGMTRHLLERFGIANTMAVRPAIVTVGGLLAMPWMGIADLGILRGIEAVAQSSFFRSGYELLFTPVVPDDKRRAKTIVDVGADRMGDIVGALLIRGIILLPAAISGRILLVLAMAISLVGYSVARRLRRGYVHALEGSLIDRAQRLDLDAGGGPGTRTTAMETFAGIDLSLSADDVELKELRDAAAASDTTPPSAPAAPASVPTDPEVALIVELRSGDPTRVAVALRATRTMSPAVASQVVSLLAWDQVTGWASRALSKAAPSITGQLIDRLLDPAEDFAIRRRIPRILATCHTPRAFDGLVTALDDPRFEVRYQSGRALARIHAQIPAVPLSHAVVYAAVARETRVGKPLWQDQRLLDEPSENDANPVIDEALRLRANRSVEHVFTLLSLVLPREPLQIAFKGLLTDDSVLRGTSLEYLESVLPGAVWQGMRPLLEDRRTTTTPPRSSAEILEALMRSSASIDLKLTPGRPPGPTRQD